MKSVVILGSGNVAENMAVAIASTSYRLLQIYARNTQRASQIALRAGCIDPYDQQDLAPADIYILAVSDRAISDVANGVKFPAGSIVAHTAGSMGIDELPSFIENRGVLYPLQTFSSSHHVEFKTIPIFVEGSSEVATRELISLGHALSDSVSTIEYEQRLKLHLAAVFACNFVNHMYAIAQNILTNNGLDPKCLTPLIMETALKVVSGEEILRPTGAISVRSEEAKVAESGKGLEDESASNKTVGDLDDYEHPVVSAIRMQTGPAVRGDMQTQKRHLELLEQQTKLKKIYKQLSLNIWETSKKI